MRASSVLLVVALVGSLQAATLDDFGDLLFTSLSPDFCVLNHLQSGPFGCTSVNDINQGPGDTAPLWPISTQAEVDTLSATLVEPVTLVMPPKLFTAANVDTLSSANLVTSVFLLGDEKPEDTWSLPGPFPNAQWGLRRDAPTDSAAVAWNAAGEDLTDTLLPFPVAWVFSEADLEAVRAGAASNKEGGLDSYPRTMGELGIFAPSAGTSQQCYNRGLVSFASKCFFNNAVGAWGSPAAIGEEDPIFMVETRYDSIGLFHNSQTGGVAYTADMVAALGAYAALAEFQEELDSFPNKIAFSFAPGDRWGYQSTLALIEAAKDPEGAFNVQSAEKLANVALILDLEQVGLNASDALIAYTDPLGGDASSLVSALSAVATAAASTALDVNTPTGGSGLEGIPPSGLMAWINDDATTVGAVLAGHDGPFNNKYFGTPFDDRSNVDDTTVCGAATIVARTMYMLANDSTDPSDVPAELEADCALVSDLLDCLISGFPCAESERLELNFVEGTRGLKFAGANPVGSLFPRNSDFLFASAFMLDRGKTLQSDECERQSQCLDAQDGTSDCILGVCVDAEVNYFYWPYAPGFSFDSETSQITDIDEQYPHYAQASPRAVVIRLYDEASPGQVTQAVVTAAVVSAASIAAVYFFTNSETMTKLKIQ